MNQDAKKLLQFVKEIDQYKNVFRTIYLDEGKRLENDAEHSWHLAMMVWVFAQHYEKKVNLDKVFKMALIHDLAEIYTGDVWSYDSQGRIGKYQREQRAMKKLLRILPTQLSREMYHLWEEYEKQQSDEAIFVQAMDKLQPIIQNILSRGKIWKNFQINEQMARERKTQHLQGSKFLMNLFNHLLLEVKRLGS